MMSIAAELKLRDGFTATFDEDLKWSHPDKEFQESLNRLNDLILDDYSIARGDRVVWFFEQVVEFIGPKEAKLLYKIPKRPTGAVVDG